MLALRHQLRANQTSILNKPEVKITQSSYIELVRLLAFKTNLNLKAGCTLGYYRKNV